MPVAGEAATADSLVKALNLTERRRVTAERDAGNCAAGADGFRTARSWVVDAGRELRCRFDVDTVFGVAGRASKSDHPQGLALDLMVDRRPGEALAEYTVKNMERLGVSYVIYRQRINFGDGWKPMGDRGGATANHMDHVHVSFEDSKPRSA